MKKFIAITLVAIGVATSARAQWVVYDPTLHTQSFLNTAQEIAKFVEMINNQVQQTQTFADQLNEFPVRVHRRDSPPRRVGGTDRRDDRRAQERNDRRGSSEAVRRTHPPFRRAYFEGLR